VRVAVAGGTRFIGLALVEELVGAGHEVLVLHRGEHEPGDAVMAEVAHLHANRRELGAGPGSPAAALAGFGPDAVVDLCAMTGPDAEALLGAIAGQPRLVVASSQDVYRAFGALLAGAVTDELPLDERAPLRDGPLPRLPRVGGWDFDLAAYDKLDVERAYLARDATVLRLPFTYGERDPQRREEAVLARVRAGRARIPVGPGTLLWSKGWVRDIARGLRLAAETDAAAGLVMNLCERRTAPMALWLGQVLAADGAALAAA
jgi:UDP-glucose 4-epimerase